MIGAHAASDFINVCIVGFAERSDFVNEADFGREHGVGGVFDHFGGGDIHDEDGIALSDEGFVDLAEAVAGLFVFDTEDDAVGDIEVVDRRAFLEELGVGGHVEFFGGLLLDGGFDFGVGPDGDGRFDDDDLFGGVVGLFDGGTDVPGALEYVAEVCVALII